MINETDNLIKLSLSRLALFYPSRRMMVPLITGDRKSGTARVLYQRSARRIYYVSNFNNVRVELAYRHDFNRVRDEFRLERGRYTWELNPRPRDSARLGGSSPVYWTLRTRIP